MVVQVDCRNCRTIELQTCGAEALRQSFQLDQRQFTLIYSNISAI